MTVRFNFINSEAFILKGTLPFAGEQTCRMRIGFAGKASDVINKLMPNET